MGPALHSDNRALRFCEAGCPLAAGGRQIIPSRGARRFCPAEFGCRRHEQAPMAGRIWLPWGLARMMESKAFIFYLAPAFTRRAFALFLFLLQRGLRHGRPQVMTGTSLPAAIEISSFPPLRPFTQAARRTARRQTRPARRARCRPCGGPARACARAHTLLYSR